MRHAIGLLSRRLLRQQIDGSGRHTQDWAPCVTCLSTTHRWGLIMKIEVEIGADLKDTGASGGEDSIHLVGISSF